MARSWSVLAAAAVVTLAGCASTVAGTPTPPPVYTGPVHAEFAYTDSFDVLPNGGCQGRGIFAHVVDGARVTILPINGPHVSTSAAATVRYLFDPARRDGDDGKYCVMTFDFTTPAPALNGYWAMFLNAGVEHLYPLDGPTFTTTVQTCEDPDAPPDRVCGEPTEWPRPPR